MNDNAQHLVSLRTGNGFETVQQVKDLVNILATYNTERARGILHTPIWRGEMEKLQQLFDDGAIK